LRTNAALIFARARALASAAGANQRGSTAVEFALVFPLFFVIFYAIVTYSLIFVAQQSLTLAAEEGARAGLRFQPTASTPAASLTLRAQAACLAATQLANWLASGTPCTASAAPCGYDPTMDCLQVQLSYNYLGNPLLPTLPLMSLGLPNTLSAQAVVQLNPENLL
jgi:hypothetical protein